jgi:hypothetical protein
MRLTELIEETEADDPIILDIVQARLANGQPIDLVMDGKPSGQLLGLDIDPTGSWVCALVLAYSYVNPNGKKMKVTEYHTPTVLKKAKLVKEPDGLKFYLNVKGRK